MPLHLQESLWEACRAAAAAAASAEQACRAPACPGFRGSLTLLLGLMHLTPKAALGWGWRTNRAREEGEEGSFPGRVPLPPSPLNPF